jgi:hypothetical protein
MAGMTTKIEQQSDNNRIKSVSSSNDTKIHDDKKTGQQLQPKIQNNNNMETLTMAQKTVAI